MAASAPSVTSMPAGSASATSVRPGNGKVAESNGMMGSSRYLATDPNKICAHCVNGKALQAPNEYVRIVADPNATARLRPGRELINGRS